MKINQVNSISFMSKGAGFRRSAVPYPEYPSVYSRRNRSVSFSHTAEAYPEYMHLQTGRNSESYIDKIKNRLHALFSPEITQKSQEIKKSINSIYDGDRRTPSHIGSAEPQLHAVYA